MEADILKGNMNGGKGRGNEPEFYKLETTKNDNHGKSKYTI